MDKTDVVSKALCLPTALWEMLYPISGSGSCDGSGEDADIVVAYGLNGCQDWHVLDSYRCVSEQFSLTDEPTVIQAHRIFNSNSIFK